MSPLFDNSTIAWFLLLAAEEEVKLQPLIKRLDGATRAKVLAALAGLVILGFLLVALAWLGARMTRRYMGPKLKPLPLPKDDEWARPSDDLEQRPRKKKG